MASATIIYEQSNAGAITVANGDVTNSAVRILPYTERRVVGLPGARVDGTYLSIAGNAFAAVELDLNTGCYRLRDLPFHLKSRLLFAPTAFDPATGTNGPALLFGGYKDAASYLGRPLLLLNILSAAERDLLLAAGTNAGGTSSAWGTAVNNLYRLTRNPNGVDLVTPDGPDAGFFAGFAENTANNTVIHANALGPKAPTAGRAAGTLGYVTLVENNAPDPAIAGTPVALHVIQVVNPPLAGLHLRRQHRRVRDSRSLDDPASPRRFLRLRVVLNEP